MEESEKHGIKKLLRVYKNKLKVSEDLLELVLDPNNTNIHYAKLYANLKTKRDCYNIMVSDIKMEMYSPVKT